MSKADLAEIFWNLLDEKNKKEVLVSASLRVLFSPEDADLEVTNRLFALGRRDGLME